MFPTRRQLLHSLGALGIGTVVFQRAVAAQAVEATSVTPEMIAQAEWVAGLKLSEEDRKTTAQTVNQTLRSCEAMRKVPLDNGVAPALHLQSGAVAAGPRRGATRYGAPDRTGRLEAAGLDRDAGFHAGECPQCPDPYTPGVVRGADEALPRRLRRYDPILHCVVNYTEELALKQAEQADREIASGRYRGPLHGIPWGAKDLIAYPGYKTTWGALPFKEQTVDTKATVARRLEEAGAVLVAKLTLGALAMGDQWFGGHDAHAVGPEAGLQRLVGRTCSGDRGGAGRFLARQRNARQHRVAVRACVAPPACVPPLAGSANMAAWRCRGAWTRSAR